jgi:broad specificity phosphatase PhoE
MRKLILIKHARPEVVEDVPSHEWELSDQGNASCGPLAEALRVHAPSMIVTSDEPKAIETGRLIAEILKVPTEIAPDLHEHDRSNVPMMRSGEFLSALAMFFKQPAQFVLGKETARQAAQRFSRGVDAVLQSHPSDNVALVTHGTVLSLFASEHGGGDPFLLYRRMGLPSFMVFSLPDLKLIDTVERIG